MRDIEELYDKSAALEDAIYSVKRVIHDIIRFFPEHADDLKFTLDEMQRDFYRIEAEIQDEERKEERIERIQFEKDTF